MLEQVGADRAKRVIATCGSDMANIEIGVQLAHLLHAPYGIHRLKETHASTEF